MKRKTAIRSLALAGAVVVVAFAAVAQDGWPGRPIPPGTVTVPVLADRDQALEPGRVAVCTNHNATPQSYEIVSRVCGGASPTCTVFVAISVEDARYRLITYDVANPPVIAPDDGPCSRPYWVSQGRLGVPTK